MEITPSLCVIIAISIFILAPTYVFEIPVLVTEPKVKKEFIIPHALSVARNCTENENETEMEMFLKLSLQLVF